MRIISREEEISSNYMEMTLYDKTKEIEQKIANGDLPASEIKKYINIFRTEIKIRNGKLNANINKGIFDDKDLCLYYNEETTDDLYSRYTQKVFGTNDFYRIDIALKEIRKSVDIKRKETKDKICQLLRLVNKKGYTAAKEIWENKYSCNTFRNHVKKIEKLGINILTFDKVIDKEPVTIEKIKNFTLLKNGVREFVNQNEWLKF